MCRARREKEEGRGEKGEGTVRTYGMNDRVERSKDMEILIVESLPKIKPTDCPLKVSQTDRT
jgi:hypothetical protein